MCGIAGKIYFNGGKINRGELYRMGEILKHRGPDDGGIYINPRGNVGLSHRRLAVVDLSPAGHQPMSNEDGTVWIAFNGEIYNFWELRRDLEKRGHKFKSSTDTEVIIHLWEDYKEGCLGYLRGMFAFAIWDERRQQLFLARDRVGQKPLKYYLGGDCLVFASELKVILANIGERFKVDLGALSSFLFFNHVPAPATGFLGIFKLPAAHYAIFQNGELTVKRYWNLDFEKKVTMNYREACREIVERLEEAVRLMLVSDVPLGAFLSGGIDSSAVVALMSRYASPVRTFTVGFSDKKLDERPLAEKVAREFGALHTEIEIKPDVMEILPDLVYRYEEPYADSSALAIFHLAQLTKKFVTVALNGDGGDEAFGGYKRFFYWNLFHNFRWDFYRTIAGYFYFGDRFNYLYTEDFLEHISRSQRSAETGQLRGMDEVLALSYKTFLPDDLMAKTDIATMACGLEARSPFLDHVLLEFAARLPSGWKVRGFSTKRILKDALRGIIPADVMRGKRGFELPVDNWFKHDLYDWASGVLLDGRSLARGYFKRQGLERVLKEHRGGKRRHGQRIWALLCLEFWHRRFFELT